MKKGFTLAETLVTIAIIGVVFAITIPILNNLKIDKDKVFYEKGMRSIQIAMMEAMNNGDIIAPDFWKKQTNETLCRTIANALNTSGSIRCQGQGNNENVNFTTTDGIKFWGIGGSALFETHGTAKVVYMERKLSNSEKKKLGQGKLRTCDGCTNVRTEEGLRFIITYDGKVTASVDGYDVMSTTPSYQRVNQDYFEYEEQLISSI